MSNGVTMVKRVDEGRVSSSIAGFADGEAPSYTTWRMSVVFTNPDDGIAPGAALAPGSGVQSSLKPSVESTSWTPVEALPFAGPSGCSERVARAPSCNERTHWRANALRTTNRGGGR